MLNNVESQSLSVVVLGNFNPSIITPHWLSLKNLIREDEANGAKVNLINNDYCSFELDWLKVEVLHDKLVLITEKEPYFPILKDLIVGIFTYLNETPIKAYGINHMYNLKSVSEKDYYNFGNILVPFNNWDFISDPRVLNLEMLDKFQDENKGYRRISIQPSEKIKNSLIININNHNVFDSNQQLKDNKFVSEFLKKWDSQSITSDEVVLNIVNKLYI